MGVLRVILALFVVFDHTRILSSLKLPDGPFAVNIFFIISGFYMTMILNEKYVGKGSYKLFITNRILRLLPLYWVVLSLTIIFSFVTFFVFNNWMQLTPYVVYNEFMDFSTILYLLATNFLLIGQDIVFFLGVNLESGAMFFTNNFLITNPHFHQFLFLPQAWTVSIEMLFYIMAPFIVRRKIPIISILIILSVLTRIIIYYHFDLFHDPWTYRFFPNELALFLIGTFSYHMYNYLKNKTIHKNYHAFVFFIYIIVLFGFNYISEIHFFININSALFFTITGLSIPSIFILTKFSHTDNRIGDLSYPIYLTHMLIIYIMNIIIIKMGLSIERNSFVLVLTILLSYILVKFISDPIEKIRHRRAPWAI